MRPDHGGIGSPLPPRPRPFSRALRCLSVRRPPHLSARFHPPVSFAPPPEFYSLRPALCTPTNLAALRKPKSASHRASSLIATSPAASTDCPGFSLPNTVPSSTFRTSSTACSATSFAGLFHPAATSRVRPTGISPSPRSRTGFPRPIHALVPLGEAHLRFDPRQRAPLSTSGPCSPR